MHAGNKYIRVFVVMMLSTHNPIVVARCILFMFLTWMDVPGLVAFFFQRLLYMYRTKKTDLLCFPNIKNIFCKISLNVVIRNSVLVTIRLQ